jgi:hypothetical protein
MSQSNDEEKKQLHLLFDALTTNSRLYVQGRRGKSDD